jgi:hypothetical protein
MKEQLLKAPSVKVLNHSPIVTKAQLKYIKFECEFHYWSTSKFSRASHPFHHLPLKTDILFLTLAHWNFGINKHQL